jgi:transposase
MIYVNLNKEYRRQLVKKLFEQGKNDKEIAYLSDYSESWVRQLRLKHEKSEVSITTLHKPGGSVCRLSTSNFDQLRQILEKGAEAYGLEGAFWDRKRIKYVIEQEFSVFYDIEHISDIVTKINFTLQKPVKKDFRQSDEKVKIWIETTLPDIKKSFVRP